MKSFTSVLLLSVVVLLPRQTLAQSKPEKPSVPVKVQIVFSEYDGEKKISSMPYSFIAITDEKLGGGYYSTSLRTGVRIPLEIDSKDQKATYMDVGSNIDCGIRTTDDNRYHLYMVFERSALYPTVGAQDDNLQTSRPFGQPPLVRQFKASENMILKDGQTSESVVSTDPLNGHSLHISVTINLLK
jgi:hypothetical protein